MSGHVESLLSAYCHGELEPGSSRRVAEHLLGCERCRASYEAVRLGMRALERLPAVTAPDGLWEQIESALGAAPATPARPRWRRFAAGVAAAASLAVAVGAAATWYASRPAGPSWHVIALEGGPLVASGRIGESGTIAEGEALETDAASRAAIRVGEIGTVDVEPNSRVRLVRASRDEHRIALDRGTLHAAIFAPPRLFFVDTPSGVAVDYGCAYTLEVADDGSSLLHVTAGWVALELGGRDALVPAGALCRTRPGVGPGTPYFDDAPERLREALSRLDAGEGGDDALGAVLAEARPRDSLTLWHLIWRRAGAERERIVDRLAALVPPPAGVTAAAVLAGDAEARDRWHALLEGTW